MYNDPPLFNTNFLRWVNTTYLKMQQLFRFQEQLLPQLCVQNDMESDAPYGWQIQNGGTECGEVA